MNARVKPQIWTPLPPIALRGLRSSSVESVNAYIVRVADISGTTPVHIMRTIRTAKKVSSNKFCSADSMTPSFPARIEALERLTGCGDLGSGSFWWLHNVIDVRSISSYRNRRRWCPECYRQWNVDSWEPLIWRVDLVKHCQQHGCLLEDRCAACSAFQPLSTPQRRRTACIKCHVPLGHSNAPDPQTGFQYWVDQQVRTLTELCATPGKKLLDPDTFVQYLDGLEQTTRFSNTIPGGLRDALRLQRSQCSRYRTTRLRTLINLCSLQAVSIEHMLFDPRSAASTPLVDLWQSFESLPLSVGFHGKKAHAFSTSLHSLLRKCPIGYLPSADLVLRAIDFNNDVARDLKPDIYAKYQERYESQASETRRIHARRAFLVALRLIGEKDDPKGGRPIVRRIAEEIARQARIEVESAELILKSARHLRRTIERAKTILQHPTDAVMDDPTWTSGL